MKDRIKLIRKENRLTQEEFAQRLGSVQNTITGYETGRREPSNQMISLICREFNVSEKWLRTGEGKMNAPEPRTEVDTLVEKYSLSDSGRTAIECFLRMKTEDRAALLRFLDDYASRRAGSVPDADDHDPTDEELHTELSRQLALEKKVEDGSEASSKDA